jgi:hypothetical protein
MFPEYVVNVDINYKLCWIYLFTNSKVLCDQTYVGLILLEFMQKIHHLKFFQ